MKIERFNGTRGSKQVGGAPTGTGKSGSTPAATPGGDLQDVVQVSGRTMELHRLSTAAQQLPDVRMEKVQKVSGQIQNGQYDVPPEEVAQAMIRGSTPITEF